MAPQDAYWKAVDIGWYEKLEDIIINSGNPFWAYQFARDIKGANIPRLEQVVIDSGDPRLAYSFAFYVPGANISDLIDFVLINEPKLIKRLFVFEPKLRHKYELGE